MRALMWTAAAALVSASLIPATGAAQSDDRGWKYLTDRMNAWASEETSYVPDVQTVTGGKLVGTLKPSGSVQLDMYWEAGRTYRVKGICDFDCKDLDLRVTNLDGSVADSDNLPNDFPILDFTASSSGWTHLTIDMANCTSAACHWGILVLRQR